MYANKQLLNFICIFPINVVTWVGDTRTVVAYMIHENDWRELERYYHRHRLPPNHYRNHKPVLRAINFGQLPDNWVIRAAR